jgi:hypothetical protein
MYLNVNNTEPFVKLPHGEQQATLDAATKLERQSREELEELAARAAHIDPADAQTSADAQPSADEKPSPSQPVTDVLFDDSFPLGSVLRNSSRNAAEWVADPPFGAPSGRRVLRQANSHFLRDTVLPELQLMVVPAEAVFEVWLRVDPQDAPSSVAIAFDVGAVSHRIFWGDDVSLEGDRGKADSPTRHGPLPAAGQWTKLSFASDDCGLKPGDRVSSIVVQQTGGVAWWDALTVRGASAPASDPLASFSAWWKAQANKTPPDVPDDLKDVLAAGSDQDSGPGRREALEAFYLAHVARPISSELAESRRKWEAARAARSTADDAIATTMIFRDLDAPRDAFVMLRGQYDKPGDKVEPAVPAILPPLRRAQPGGRATRLDLARWLVSPDQPLTARVQINRLWQQLFGVGLVKTSYDFGSQGEMPSHAELLDWLAVRFRDSGWDTRAMVRLLVTSAAFRQRAFQSLELRARDPENRLLARGPRVRLDAEQVRDDALFVAGLINLEMGGRGVKPYQPPNIWEPVGYGDSNTRYYLQDHGPALYRRSLYVFLKRTAPPPFMSNFDGPSREQFCTRRERSNTPLQALQLMNDTQHFEAARALAERVLEQGGPTAEERIVFLYRTVLSRPPDADEVKFIKQAYQTQRALFDADPPAAAKVIEVGESAPKRLHTNEETAAWTLVANLVLNLDETVNRN